MSTAEAIDDGLSWVDDLACEVATWGPPGCVICDRPQATETTIEGRRWWVCDNPGCALLLQGVTTIGELAAARTAGS